MKNSFYYLLKGGARRALPVVLVLLTIISSVSAADTTFPENDLQKSRVTLSLTRASLQNFIKSVETQTSFRFTFDEKELADKKGISVVARNEPLDKVLERITAETGLEFKLVNNNIHIRLPKAYGIQQRTSLPIRATAQENVTVSGRVTDTNGIGLPGVTVLLKGTTTATPTDNHGTYTITVPDGNGTLVFSYIGYQPQEIAINNRTKIDVKLADDAKALEEVVVVGYATQKKVSMTSAVSEVKGEELARRPVSNVQQALQGQLPGLTVTDQGGGPGKSAASMRVRGITTLSDNNPLVIVDGIEQRLSDVNPDDIESISLLKDASSTSIYGSRAANGVVLITTKRAKLGKVSVSYNGFYALQQSINKPEHMEVGEYMRLQNIAYQNVGQNAKYTEQQIQEHVNATDRLKYPLPNTWYNTVLRTAPQVNHSLAVSGGNENFKARLSIRYQDQDGIIANSESKIREVRVNTDFRVSPKINVGTDVNYRYNTYLSPVNEAIVFDRMLHGSLWAVPKYPDGTYGLSAQGHNPLMYAESAGTSRMADDYIVGNIKGDWEILKDLKFTTQFAARMNMVAGKNFSNSYTIYDYDNPTIIRKAVPLSNLTEIRNNTREFTLNNLLNYSVTLGSHTLNTLVGYSEIENKASSLTAFRQNFYNNEIQSISQGVNDATKDNGGRELEWGLRSYFGRFNYGFKEKYLFEANGRYDGSSRFLDDRRYSFFPSFSAGWRVSEENFWGDLSSYINELKFRGSWGKTGNQAVDLYSYYTTLNLLSYSFNGAPVQGYTQQRMANENLTWETTTQTNVGIDAQFLNNRVSLGVDYYNKRTDGILLTLPVPGTLGLEAPPQNAGIVDNKGWEFLLGTRNSFGQFGINASINFSINSNNVVSLAGTGPYITGSDINPRYITGEGYPINSFWGYKTDGFFRRKKKY